MQRNQKINKKIVEQMKTGFFAVIKKGQTHFK